MVFLQLIVNRLVEWFAGACPEQWKSGNFTVGSQPMTSRAPAVGFILSEDRKLRPIWRAILFVLLTVFVVMPLLNKLLDLIIGPAPSFEFSPSIVAQAEGFNLACGLIVVGLFAWYEHRSIDSYGMPIGLALRQTTWEGVAVGVVQPTIVALAMYAFGAMRVRGFALSGSALALSALAWLGTCILIGIAEEFLIRGYLLQTLWKAIGFWPASAVVSALFAGAHYILKPGENVADMLALVSFSLLCCYSVLRTGNLWFAVGLHAAYDFMQLFVIGTPNGGQFPVGRLLDATFNGPAWLTGGPLGTEASWLAVPLDLLAAAYLWRRFRGKPDFQPA
jgi:membrane protease YdiL (CAAX protease family)